VREYYKKRFECELRFNGDSYGTEAQIFEGGEIFTAHGRFVTRALTSSGPRRSGNSSRSGLVAAG